VEYQKTIDAKIREDVPTEPMKIQNSTVTFFLLTKDENVRRTLAHFIHKYNRESHNTKIVI
jgi:ABC-type Fe3+/spermidine/putrescine transport system ATPase subunit